MRTEPWTESFSTFVKGEGDVVNLKGVVRQ